MSIDNVRGQYGPKITNLLNTLRDRLLLNNVSAGNVFEDTACNEYHWHLQLNDKRKTLIIVSIAESVNWDTEGLGINFVLAVINKLTILAVIMPHNYTKNCWVMLDNPDAIKQRWQEFRDACNISNLVKMITEFESDDIS